MKSTDHENIPEIIRTSLCSRTPRDISGDGFAHAGVLIPLLSVNGEYRVLFTKRTESVEHHKGQISFPGGKVDPEDFSFEHTALREAREEIGLREADVEILGRTDDMVAAVSNFVMHSFVGIVPYPYEFELSPVEVERLILVPLGVFHPGNPQKKQWTARYKEITYNTPAFEYGEDLIWGATARVMENFMEVVGTHLPLPAGEK